MADKITKSMKVAASGILNIENDDICIEVEDKGSFSLKKLLRMFDGCGVKLSCSYDEEQESPDEPEVDTETGEVIE